MDEWKPIKTAPEDDTYIDCWIRGADADRIPDCRYRDPDTFIDAHGGIWKRSEFSHWMLPPRPPLTTDA